MIGPILVYSLLAFVCIAALVRPAIGLIGFYGFMLLDPQWNWRWSLPPDMTYQKYIFIALIIGFGLSGFRGQSLSRQSKVGLACLLGFYCVCFASSMQTVAAEPTAFFMALIWKILLVVALGILLLDTPGRIKALLIVAVVTQGYNAFQINLDYFQTGFSRFAYESWGSFGGDNNGYSLLTVPILGISFSLGLFESTLWKRCLFFGIALLQVHQLMLLQSRGCMLGAVIMIVLIIWKMPQRNNNLAWVVLAAIIGSALAGPSVVEEFSSSFAAAEERDASAESRFVLWQAGAKIGMDYPVLGVGPNAARVLVPLPQYYEGGLDANNKALHNLFFDVLTGTGVLGAALYCTIFLIPIFYTLKSYSPDNDATGAARLSVFAGLTGYLLSSMFSSGILLEPCYILILVGFCLSNIDLSKAASLEAPTDVDDVFITKTIVH